MIGAVVADTRSRCEIMRPSQVINAHRGAIREITQRYHAANPRVFGSVLSGTDGPTSDLDLLVDALPNASLVDLGNLQEALQALLGVRVDVRTPGDLPRAIREKVLAEADPV